MSSRPLAASAHSADLPDPHIWAAHIAQAILDTLSGTRPAHQLARWTDRAVYNSILSTTSLKSRAPGATRPAVRSIRIAMPVAHAAEASVLIQTGNRYRAAAMRLESVGGRWKCTVFELI